MLEVGIKLPTGEVADLLAGKLRNASMLWPVIKDVYFKLFSDTSGVTDKDSFVSWFEESVPRCVIAVDKAGNCISCAYLTDLQPGHQALFHAFSGINHRRPDLTKLLALKAIDHLIKHYSLQRLHAVGRNDHRLARMTAASLGFFGNDTLPQHKMHDGEWKDYFMKVLTRRSR